MSSPGQSQSSPEYRQKKTQNAVSVEISTETCGQETIKIQAKKDIVKAFIKQFLDDNPEAALDSKLMAGLSEKANQLIDCSFHLDDDCNAP